MLCVVRQLLAAGSWLVGRVSALLSPWRSVTAPVYQTGRNIVLVTVGYIRDLTAGLRHRAGGE